jgi:hypothetical protein
VLLADGLCAERRAAHVPGRRRDAPAHHRGLPAGKVGPDDAVGDDGREVFNLLEHRQRRPAMPGVIITFAP